MNDNITVTGNIATDPDYKRTPAGVTITSFRVASSHRRFDRGRGEWVDGPTSFFTVSTFRGLAENAFASFKKGDRVLVTGRLRVRDWETSTARGTTAEIEAEAVGHDLLWGTTTFHRSPRTTPSAPNDDEQQWSADPIGQTPAVADHVPDSWTVPGAPLDATGDEPAALEAVPVDVPF